MRYFAQIFTLSSLVLALLTGMCLAQGVTPQDQALQDDAIFALEQRAAQLQGAQRELRKFKETLSPARREEQFRAWVAKYGLVDKGQLDKAIAAAADGPNGWKAAIDDLRVSITAKIDANAAAIEANKAAIEANRAATADLSDRVGKGEKEIRQLKQAVNSHTLGVRTLGTVAGAGDLTINALTAGPVWQLRPALWVDIELYAGVGAAWHEAKVVKETVARGELQGSALFHLSDRFLLGPAIVSSFDGGDINTASTTGAAVDFRWKPLSELALGAMVGKQWTSAAHWDEGDGSISRHDGDFWFAGLSLTLIPGDATVSD